MWHKSRTLLCSASVNNKASPWGWRDNIPPSMAVRSKNYGGSTPVRGRVRSPHISGGRRWLSCRQPACLQPRLGQTDGRIAVSLNDPLRQGHNNSESPTCARSYAKLIHCTARPMTPVVKCRLQRRDTNHHHRTDGVAG